MIYFAALNSEGVLEKALFANYSKDVRPVSYYFDPLEVDLGYNLGKIEQLVCEIQPFKNSLSHDICWGLCCDLFCLFYFVLYCFLLSADYCDLFIHIIHWQWSKRMIIRDTSQLSIYYYYYYYCYYYYYHHYYYHYHIVIIIIIIIVVIVFVHPIQSKTHTDISKQYHTFVKGIYSSQSIRGLPYTDTETSVWL